MVDQLTPPPTPVDGGTALPGENVGASDLAQAAENFNTAGNLDQVADNLSPAEAMAPGVTDHQPSMGPGIDGQATEVQAAADAAQVPSTPPVDPNRLPAATGNQQLDEIADKMTVTPEMVAAFKERNPAMGQLDDAQADRALRLSMAAQVLQHRSQTEPSGEDPSPPPNPERPYSIWRDLASIPQAIAAGAAKGMFESYDAVNEIVLGNDADPSEMRKGIEAYYDGTSGVSGAAAVVAQFGVMFVGLGKFARAAKLFKAPTSTATAVGQGAAVGAATDFLAFDGLEGRLSDLVQQYPALDNPITAYLATDPSDTQATGRLKNAIEGLGLGVAADVVLNGLRAIRAKRSLDAGGDPAVANAEVEASIDDAAKAFDDTVNTADADPRGASPADEPVMWPEGLTPEGTAPPARTPPPAPEPPRLDDPQLAAKVKEFVNRAIKDPSPTPMDTTVPGGIGDIPERVPTPSTFDSLTEMGSLRAAIQQVEDGILSGISGSATARGRVTLEETHRLATQLADETGQSPGEFFARLQKDAGSIENMHARLHAYNAVQKEMAHELVDLARGVQTGNPGQFGTVEALVEAFETRLAQYAQVQDWMKGIRAETGRALNIMRYTEAAGMGIDAQGILNAGTRGRSPMDLSEAIIMASANPKKLRKRLGEIADPTRYQQFRDAAVSLFIKNILSGPATHAVNILGNASAQIAHPATKILGGIVTRDPQIIREGAKQYAFMVTDALHSLKMARAAYSMGENILDPRFSKFSDTGFHEEALSMQAITGGMVPNDSYAGRLGNGVFKVLDGISTRALGAADEFFKQSVYTSEIMARAWSEGIAQGLTGDQLKAHILQRRAQAFTTNDAMQARGAPPMTAQAVVDKKSATSDQIEALSAARFSTFTDAPRQGTFARSILELTNRHPELKFAVPFVRVVRNLLNHAWHHSPLAPLAAEFREAVARGGRDAAVAWGRVTVGSTIWTLAGAAAYNGMLTGEGPVKSDGSPDWKRREMLKATGWRPNALKIGDTYYAIDRLDPFGLPFSLAARVNEAYERGQLTDSQMEEVAGAMALGLAQTVVDRQYLKGIADLAEAIFDDSGAASSGYFGRLASSILIPNAARQKIGIDAVDSARGVDPQLRHAKGFVESFLRNTPYASQGLVGKRLPWGEPVMKNSPLWNEMSKDPVLVEFARLLETGDSGTGQPLPRMWTVQGGKSIDTATFRLSNGETLYDQYADYVQDPAPGEVPPLKEVLADLIQSREYREEMQDGPGAFRGTRLKAWGTIMARYRDMAKRRILKEFPEVKQRINEPRQLAYQKAEGEDNANREVQEFIEQ